MRMILHQERARQRRSGPGQAGRTEPGIVPLAILNDSRYYSYVIRSFADADTEMLWDTGKSRRIPANIRSSALKKLSLLDSAEALADLTEPPGNHLEALAKNRRGQHSIRINKQFRLCFVLRLGNAYEVEIVDYH